MSDRLPLVVLGAGPAGLAAASVAVAVGVPTLLLDEQPEAGGQIYRSVGRATSAQHEILGVDYGAGRPLLDILGRQGLDYRPGATVWEVSDEGTVYYTREGRAETVAADQIVLCPGALERPMPFPGWTLPGVMTCGAAQILLKGAGAFPGEGTVVAGSGPLLLLLSLQLLRAGARLEAVVETTPARNTAAALRYLPAALRTPAYLTKGLRMIRDLRASGLSWYRGATDLEAFGDETVAGLRFRSGRERRELACRTLLLHQGVVPNVQLSRALGLEHDWDALPRCWRPRLDAWGGSALARIAISGDGSGIMGAAASEAHGRLAGLGALQRLGALTVAERDRHATEPLARYRKEIAPRPFLDRLYQPHPDYLNPADETVVCRCEEVTAGQIRDYVRLGCLGPNQAKAFGRSGMGPCQGRFCGLTVSEIIARTRGVGVEEVGYYRIRPPIKPVTLAELAAMEDAGSSGEEIL